MAWGIGCDFALGAMAMGADAVQAVEITNKFSIHCGMGVDSYGNDAIACKQGIVKNEQGKLLNYLLQRLR
jgi:hypothetical protein